MDTQALHISLVEISPISKVVSGSAQRAHTLFITWGRLQHLSAPRTWGHASEAAQPTTLKYARHQQPCWPFVSGLSTTQSHLGRVPEVLRVALSGARLEDAFGKRPRLLRGGRLDVDLDPRLLGVPPHHPGDQREDGERDALEVGESAGANHVRPPDVEGVALGQGSQRRNGLEHAQLVVVRPGRLGHLDGAHAREALLTKY